MSVMNLDWSIRPLVVWMRIIGVDVEDVSAGPVRRTLAYVWRRAALLAGLVTWFYLMRKVKWIQQ